MIARIHDKIRNALETTPGLTQKGLAEHMGLNPAAVNRMLYGRRNIMAEEIPVIEQYIGIKLDLSLSAFAQNLEYAQDKSPASHRRGFSDRTAQIFPFAASNQIPFAVYVFADDMAPRYFKGEIAYVHPDKVPEVGRDCFIEMKNGEVHIKRLVKESEDRLRLAQFNPAQEKDILRRDIKTIKAIVGRG